MNGEGGSPFFCVIFLSESCQFEPGISVIGMTDFADMYRNKGLYIFLTESVENTVENAAKNGEIPAVTRVLTDCTIAARTL